MSTYAVFGMAPHRANALARKFVDAIEIARKRAFGEPHYSERVAEQEAAILASTRSVQLSEKFDAPCFAHEFLAIAKRDGAIRLHVKCYCIQGYNEKTRKPRYGWVDETDAPGLERARQLAQTGQLSR